MGTLRKTPTRKTKRSYLNVRRARSGLYGASDSADRAVDVTKNGVISRVLERTRQCARVGEVRKCDITEAFEAKVKEVEVLRNDGMRRAGEVKREGVLDRANCEDG
jgi:hypothetical protein